MATYTTVLYDSHFHLQCQVAFRNPYLVFLHPQLLHFVPWNHTSVRAWLMLLLWLPDRIHGRPDELLFCRWIAILFWGVRRCWFPINALTFDIYLNCFAFVSIVWVEHLDFAFIISFETTLKLLETLQRVSFTWDHCYLFKGWEHITESDEVFLSTEALDGKRTADVWEYHLSRCSKFFIPTDKLSLFCFHSVQGTQITSLCDFYLNESPDTDPSFSMLLIVRRHTWQTFLSHSSSASVLASETCAMESMRAPCNT